MATQKEDRIALNAVRQIIDQQIEISALKARLAEADELSTALAKLLEADRTRPANDERDAARYRWLKSRAEDYDGHVTFPEVRYLNGLQDGKSARTVDEAIDAAIADSGDTNTGSNRISPAIQSTAAPVAGYLKPDTNRSDNRINAVEGIHDISGNSHDVADSASQVCPAIDCCFEIHGAGTCPSCGRTGVTVSGVKE